MSSCTAAIICAGSEKYYKKSIFGSHKRTPYHQTSRTEHKITIQYWSLAENEWRKRIFPNETESDRANDIHASQNIFANRDEKGDFWLDASEICFYSITHRYQNMWWCVYEYVSYSLNWNGITDNSNVHSSKPQWNGIHVTVSK